MVWNGNHAHAKDSFVIIYKQPVSQYNYVSNPNSQQRVGLCDSIGQHCRQHARGEASHAHQT